MGTSSEPGFDNKFFVIKPKVEGTEEKLKVDLTLKSEGSIQKIRQVFSIQYDADLRPQNTDGPNSQGPTHHLSFQLQPLSGHQLALWCSHVKLGRQGHSIQIITRVNI